MSRRFAPPIRIALVCTTACLLSVWMGMFRGWQLWWLDLQFQYREAKRPDAERSALHSREIALVAVDEASAANWQHRSPTPRRHLAQVITELKRAGARVILLDIRLDAHVEGDAELLRAMRDAGNVVVPSWIA